MPQKKPKPKIEEVTQKFGKAHRAKAEAEAEMKKYRGLFFELIKIPEDQLARQSLWVDGDEDPHHYVATFYPKWKVLKAEKVQDEWKVIIQEDPTKKSYTYVNPVDGMVYTRTVVEGAPDVDLESLKEKDPDLWVAISFVPEPVRELKPLDELTEDQKEALRKFLTEAKLTNKMAAPRKPKPEELEASEAGSTVT